MLAGKEWCVESHSGAIVVGPGKVSTASSQPVFRHLSSARAGYSWGAKEIVKHSYGFKECLCLCGFREGFCVVALLNMFCYLCMCMHGCAYVLVSVSEDSIQELALLPPC